MIYYYGTFKAILNEYCNKDKMQCYMAFWQ